MTGLTVLSEPSGWLSQLQLRLAVAFRSVVPNLTESTKERFDRSYLLFLGAIEVVQKFDQEQAMKELDNIKDIQKWSLRYESILEKSNFMNDVEVKEKWNLCMDALYKLEGELRIIAYSRQPKANADKEYIKALSEKSKESVESVLSKYAA